MPNETILVVDDEPDILELVRYNLSRESYSVICATSGESGLQLAQDNHPDLVLLDLMLPGIDGLEVCRLLKSNQRTRDIPILMLSAKGEEADVVTGLEVGADDYIVKPFSPRVMLARVRTVLRRKHAPSPAENIPVRVDGLTIDPQRHEIKADGSLLDLTFSEFRILHHLARQRGLVFTRYQIVEAVHGDDYPVTDRSVDVQIVGLRKKLGKYGKLIETVRGVGYRMQG